MNRQGKDCPKCGKDIGVWVILKAPVPGTLKCKHCGTKIAYESKGWPMLIVFALVYFALLAWLIGISGLRDHLNFFVFIALIFALWMPFELVIIKILRGHHKLVAK